MTCEPIIASEFVKKMIPIIDEARQMIDICVFDWRWYPQDPGSVAQLYNQAVIRAIKRGVCVRAIVNSQQVADTLREAGAKTKKHISAHLLHTKLMIVDDSIIITGSHNYTQSAFSANYELSVILRDVVAIGDFSNFFNALWSR